jgi:hypothetical protein
MYNRTFKASHASMGNEDAQSQRDPEPTDLVADFIDRLAKHPEILPTVLDKLQDIKSSDVD